MRLHVSHTTEYTYNEPVGYALQQLRLMPKASTGQRVLSWTTDISGGNKEVSYTDQHRNHVELVSFDQTLEKVTITCKGEIESTLADGVVGKHIGLAPLWYFLRSTSLTKPGPSLKKLAKDFEKSELDDIGRFHAIMAEILNQVPYEIGKTDAATTAEEALSSGNGVCQDHAHILLSVARLLGRPARYVSGYLMLQDRINQDASHAWAEVFFDAIGWIGFDVSNGICPDEKYIRVATGLDYNEAAPISGLRYGTAEETMVVNLKVEQ